MSVLVEAFLAEVRAIMALNPTYRLGGKGEDGTCDCVGLIIGALTRAGYAWRGIHGSNWAARHEISGTLLPMTNLLPGMAVFKAYEPGSGGYDLPERYQAGGSAANGDLRDYYHVGVVLSAQPLKIAHCTTGGGVDGIVTDTRLGKWAFAARLKGVAYDDSGVRDGLSNGAGGVSGGVSVGVPGGLTGTCVVSTGNSLPLNLRAGASRSEKIVNRIPDGDTVTVLKSGLGKDGAWSRVKWRSHTGYVQARFLVESSRASGGLGASGGGAASIPADASAIPADVATLAEAVARLEERVTALEGGRG